MATRALDVVTIMHALSVLDQELHTTGWDAKNEQQAQLFDWLGQYRNELVKITGLEALASRSYQALNEFLTNRKFSPMVQPFNPKMGIGVVSILDKLIQWLTGPGALVKIPTARGERPGFELPSADVNIYEVDGYDRSYLLELRTQSADSLWLFAHDNTSLTGLDMVRLSFDVMKKKRQPASVYAGAQILMLDFDVKPDISWLCGADTKTASDEYYYIAQAAQQFKMRMDQTGARVKVATTIVTMRSAVMNKPKVFILDCPFYGWWTQMSVALPMATFFADWDSLHQPAGSLVDL